MSFEYKIVVVGAGGVGKSALTVRFIQGNFIERYDPTIEDSYRKGIEVDGFACMLDIMDTAGQEEYSALRDQYMRTGHGFVLCYSIISRSSFDTTHRLRTSILRIKEEEGPDIPIVLVATKADLESERAVSIKEGESLAAKFKAPFLETSAKNNMNVNNVFIETVRAIKKWREQNPEKMKKNRKADSRCVLL